MSPALTLGEIVLISTNLTMLLLTGCQPALEAAELACEAAQRTLREAYQSGCTYRTDPEHLQGYTKGISSSPSTRQTRQTSANQHDF